jgi:hypothetical protein
MYVRIIHIMGRLLSLFLLAATTYIWGPTNEKRKTYGKEFVQITLNFLTPYK